MVQTKKNSSSRVLNVELNVLATPQCCSRSCLTCPVGKSFFTRDLHLEDAEVFGSQKRRPDTPIGDDGKTHRPDTMHFSRPRPGKRVTRSQPETLTYYH